MLTRLLLACCLLAPSSAIANDLSVAAAPFGKSTDGAEVKLYTLTNSHGLRVQVMSYGATIVSVETPDRDGKLANIVRRYESLDQYVANRGVTGTIVGRYANRIADGKFTLDGVTYELPKNAGKHHIHGGPNGFHRVVWKAEELKEPKRVGVKMTYSSRDGEAGFPGNLNATVAYWLTDDNELVMDYEATTDKATHVNLTNHAYWNLSGDPKREVLDHEVTILADRYVPVDDDRIPTGDPVPVKDTPVDFNRPTKIGARIDQLPTGYDHCFALSKPAGATAAGEKLALAARVVEPNTGRTMDVLTTQPGVQLYTDGKQRRAVCLETQHYPDTPNRPSFPTTVLRPGEKYRETTIHRFGVMKQPSSPSF